MIDVNYIPSKQTPELVDTYAEASQYGFNMIKTGLKQKTAVPEPNVEINSEMDREAEEKE